MNWTIGNPLGNPLTCEQIRRVDRVAIESWDIPGILLMENAGRGLADVLCQLGISGSVVIACAKGNNGGDGLVLARHLHLRGFEVHVVLACQPSEFSGDAAWNFDLLSRTQVNVSELSALTETRIQDLFGKANWLVDALLGTGAVGDPRSPLPSLITRMNESDTRKLAVDIPSGLSGVTGRPGTPTFRADHTCTFVAEKEGFRNPAALPYLGQVHILDIGLPQELVAEAIRQA